MPERARESVWDYPRPPRVERCDRRVRVIVAGVVVAESDRALRVLETSSPPTIYVPREDVRGEHLRPAEGKTVCEFKGTASYHDVVVGERVVESAAWSYRRPTTVIRSFAITSPSTRAVSTRHTSTRRP